MPKRPKKQNTECLADRVFRLIQEGGLLHAGDQVGAAASGGADSIALLLLLHGLGDRLGIVLNAVHFNHKLRHIASDKDEAFVAKLAKKLAIPFFSAHADIAAKAKREKANLEDAARRGRYEFFARLIHEGKLTHVATAHTADDQAETVLAHILRGTGLTGLGGVHPRVEHVVRPLLEIRRSELRKFLQAQKQTWREDATNQDLTKTRAKIRKKLIPLLEKQFQTSTVEHLVQLAEFARADEAFLNELAKIQVATKVNTIGDEKKISISDLLQCSSENIPSSSVALSSRVIRHILEEIKPGEGQISAQHVDAILELACTGENGKSISLPGRVEVRRERENLVFLPQPTGRRSSAKTSSREPVSKLRKNQTRVQDKASTSCVYAYNIDMLEGSTTVDVPELRCAFRLREIDWTAKRGETSYLGAALNRYRLQFPLVLRNWRPGDRFQPWGHRNAHKMKRLLNEKRISRWERDGWPVLTSGGTLVWARGFPVAAAFAADDSAQIGIVIAEDKYS